MLADIAHSSADDIHRACVLLSDAKSVSDEERADAAMLLERMNATP